MSNKLNVDRLMQALSEILTDKHGVEIVYKAKPKEDAKNEKADFQPA